MQISHILTDSPSKNSILQSFISPDNTPDRLKNQFLMKKVALANKLSINEYQQRATLCHLGIPLVYTQQNSQFYMTVYFERRQSFHLKDLLLLPFQKRAIFFVNVLKSVQILSRIYGYFYLTQPMLGYNSNGLITVWINQEISVNKRKYPINHNRYSEQIFVSDFKEGFGGTLKNMKEFLKVKTVQGLIQILDRGKNVHTSLHIDSLFCQQDYTSKINSLKYSNLVDYASGIMKNSNFIGKDQLNFQHNALQSLQSAKFTNTKEQNHVIENKRLMKSMSSPIFHQENLNGKGIKYIFQHEQKAERNSFACSTATSLPRINFTYISNNAQKKKEQIISTNQNSPFLNFAKKSYFSQQKSTQSKHISNQPLKMSFPHTTTHSYNPLIYSDGNIKLSFNQNVNSNNKGFSFILQTQQQQEKGESMLCEELMNMQVQMQNLFGSQNKQEKISINDQFQKIEMELQNLFSSTILQEQQNKIEMIMQEFQDIFSA